MGAHVFPFPLSCTPHHARMERAALGPPRAGRWAPNLHPPCGAKASVLGCSVSGSGTGLARSGPAGGRGREGRSEEVLKVEEVEKPAGKEEQEHLLGAHRAPRLLAGWPQHRAAPGAPSPGPQRSLPGVSSSTPPRRQELFHPPGNQSSASGLAVSRSADKATCPWRKLPPAGLPGRSFGCLPPACGVGILGRLPL